MLTNVGGSFGLFLFAHRIAHRPLCPPLLIDIGEQAHRSAEHPYHSSEYAHHSDSQFRTNYSVSMLTAIAHRHSICVHAHRMLADLHRTKR